MQQQRLANQIYHIAKQRNDQQQLVNLTSQQQTLAAQQQRISIKNEEQHLTEQVSKQNQLVEQQKRQLQTQHIPEPVGYQEQPQHVEFHRTGTALVGVQDRRFSQDVCSREFAMELYQLQVRDGSIPASEDNRLSRADRLECHEKESEETSFIQAPTVGSSIIELSSLTR